MNRFERVAKPLRWFIALLLTAFVAGCGGGDGNTVVVSNLVSVAVTPATASIPVSGTQQFVATATYSDGSSSVVTTNIGTNWTSSDTGIATVSTSGIAIGVASGTSIITAAFGGQAATATLTVTAATVTSIEVTPATASIPIGLTQQFTATATYSDGSSLVVTANPGTNWTSADTNVATVLSTGVATGVAIGTSVITATFGGQAATATLTVTAATVTSLAVTPATASIPVSGTQPFTATATYSDLTTSVVTASWTSGTPGVATVDSATGVATGIGFGTSDITATFGGQTSPAATLTVTDPGPAGAAPDLGAAGTYGVFASSDATVTLAADSLVTGDVGLMDGSGMCNNCTGVTVTGTVHNGDQAATDAQAAFRAAYTDAANRSTNLCTLAANTEIADPQGACAFVTPGTPGPTYGPGLYWSASTIILGVGKTVTLDAQNNPDAVFIFQAGTAITTGDNSIVVLANQAQARNVFWMAGTAATIGVSSIFKGTVIAGGPAAAAITVLGGTAVAPTTVTGRLFSSGAGIDVGTYATVTVPQ